MSAEALILNGYLTATRDTGEPRDIEYQLFSRITGKLNRARQDGGSFPDLAAALNENLALWRTIALDVADDGNQLPQQLRAQLFYLYEFTAAHTEKVLRRTASPDALIDVNTSVMRGLKPRAANKD